MNFTIEDLKGAIKERASIQLKSGLTRDGWRKNIKRTNILNMVAYNDDGPIDRSIRFELYEISAEGVEPHWVICGALLRFDDIMNEDIDMNGDIFFTLDEALEGLCKKVNAMQIVVDEDYKIEN